MIRARGFTLLEVLIAMSITAVVAVAAYSGMSSAMDGVEATRKVAERNYEIERAWMIISRDLRQFVERPVRDEFGELEAAMAGGQAARFLLSFTRSGWHNPNGQLRSSLQRVNYVLEDESLWRESYAVLDRAGDSEPRRALLLADVEAVELGFLANLESVEADNQGEGLDSRNWPDNWVSPSGGSGSSLAPPVAIEVRITLPEVGEMRRLYALPPL